MCTHACYINNCTNNKKSHFQYNDNKNREFSFYECVMGGGGLFHTASYFLKREVALNMPNCFNCKWMGDYQLMMFAAIVGKVYYINESMSVYNYMTSNSWSKDVLLNKSKYIQSNKDIIKMFEKIDEFYNYKFHDVISKCIDKHLIWNYLANNDYRYVKHNYNYYYKSLSKKGKIKFNLKCLFEKQLKKKYNSN